MRTIRTIGLVCGLAMAAMVCQPAMATSTGILDVQLGASTSPNGIEFTFLYPDDLTITIGACPFTGSSCTAGNPITGGLTVSGLSSTYSLAADGPLTATFAGQSPAGVNTWTISGPSDSFFLGPSGSPLVSGTIDWTSVVENSAGVSMLGTVDYSGVGSIGSGTVDISVLLAPLTCNFAGQCTLGNITDVGGDPPSAFSSVGSGSFSTPSTTPEPGTLLLLGSALPGLLGFGLLRRRFA